MRELTAPDKTVLAHRSGVRSLDNAFTLIEGHGPPGNIQTARCDIFFTFLIEAERFNGTAR
jgi:hypothetical protein